jgi:predicted  nucleic acid-binding Zn-ribbon protein
VNIDELGQLTLEHLRAIRSDLADFKERVTGLEVAVSAMGQQLGALTTAVYSGHSRLDDFERRLNRIERRLELRDAEP